MIQYPDYIIKKYYRLKPISASFFLAFLIFSFIQCKSNQTQEIATVSIPNDTLPEVVSLKEFELRLKSIIDQNKLHQSLLIKDHELFDLAHIDEGYDTTYSYRLVDTLSSSSMIPVYIIAREYDNEDIAWYCKYTPQHKIEYFKEVFYENAEGNLLIESKFKNDTLTLFIDDINEGKVREVSVLDSVYHFLDIKK